MPRRLNEASTARLLAVLHASGVSLPAGARDFEVVLLQPGRHGRAAGAWSWVLRAQCGTDNRDAGTKTELWGSPDPTGAIFRVGRVTVAEGPNVWRTVYADI